MSVCSYTKKIMWGKRFKSAKNKETNGKLSLLRFQKLRYRSWFESSSLPDKPGLIYISKCQKLIGELMFIGVITSPEILSALSDSSRYLTKVTPQHDIHTKHSFRYVWDHKHANNNLVRPFKAGQFHSCAVGKARFNCMWIDTMTSAKIHTVWWFELDYLLTHQLSYVCVCGVVEWCWQVCRWS
jgi:hypothetical protein